MPRDVTATLRLRVVDGAREPFFGPMLVAVFDGLQRIVHRATHTSPQIVFTLPVIDGPTDVYKVVVTSRDRLDAGQTGLRVVAGVESVVDVMMLPRHSVFRFDPLSSLDGVHQRLKPLVEAFLVKEGHSSDEAGYQQLQKDKPGELATLLSISSAFAGFGSGPPRATPFLMDDAARSHPLDFIEELRELRLERFFATVKNETDGMLDWLKSSARTFTPARHRFHAGAFCSFKELRFPEGNVQFTFSNDDNDSKTLIVDSDIDLFRDTASHLLLEVLPTDGLRLNDGTDPRQAYAFRWMCVQRLKDTTGLDFEPPFTIVSG